MKDNATPLMDILKEIKERAERTRSYLAADGFLNRITPAHLREAAAAYLARGGKGLRPALTLFACGAAGADERLALAAAAAAEVTHNWTLIHDDIIDRDDRRRGGPTVHVAFAARGRDDFGWPAADAHYGLSVAVLAGDVGPCWAAHLLSRLPENGATSPATAFALATSLAAKVVPDILAGEAADVTLSRTEIEKVQLEEVEEMLARKTGALYGWCARAGATVGGADDATTELLGEFGTKVGLAFQHIDDTLPFVAADEDTGKSAISDLREGKRTAVVWGAYRRATPAQRDFLARALRGADVDDATLAAAKELLVELGGVSFARDRADKFYREALALLEKLPPSHHRNLLAAWARFMVARTF